MPERQLRRRTLLQRAFVLDSRNLGARVVRGAGFQFLGIILRTLLTLGSTAVLARLLMPADFGYVAMATVITELVSLLANFGFTNLLIQRRRITRLQVDTVFWASTALGVALTVIALLVSYFGGWLFGDPVVRQLLQVLALSFALTGLSSVSWVVLARLMRFRTEFWMQTSVVAIRTFVAIGCAWAGFGVWSLVVGGMAGAAAQVVMSFVAVPYRPRLRFQASFLANSWRTSTSYLGGGFLYYVNMNVDLALIGRYLGATPLGYYQNARSLTDEIRGRIAIPIQHVLFPAFAAVQAEPERHRELVLRAARLLSALVIPIGFGVSANAPELVLVLYGAKWTAMTPLIVLFGLSAAIRASTAIASPLFNAANRVGLALRYNIIGTVIMVVAVALALPYGIVAVGVAMTVSNLYTLIVLRGSFKLIGLGSRHVVKTLGPPLLASGALWAATHGVRSLDAAWAGHAAVQLAVQVVCGGIVYVLVLPLLSRVYLRELAQVVARFTRARNPRRASGG